MDNPGYFYASKWIKTVFSGKIRLWTVDVPEKLSTSVCIIPDLCSRLMLTAPLCVVKKGFFKYNSRMDDFMQVKENWQEILETVRRDHELSSVSFSAWLAPLVLKSVRSGVLTLLVPHGCMAITILDKKYSLPLKVAIAEVTGLSLDLNFISPDDADSQEESRSRLEISIQKAGLDSRYTFDEFVVGPNNQFANAAALAVAESPGEVYNPLYLYAGVGLGKTHLMQSICHYILEIDPSKNVLYVTSEVFTNELITAIRNKDNAAIATFRNKYRNIDVLAIDDIQFIIGKESTQEEFFHTFNALYGSKKQIIISSDKPPKDLDILEERIMSRLEMGLIADISAPDYETRMAILRKKEEQEGYILEDDVRDYIAANITSNVRILEGCVTRLKAKHRLEKKDINKEMAEDILRDIIGPDKERRITSEDIIDAVLEHFHLEKEDLMSQRRNSEIVYPRQVAMYLMRLMTLDPLKSIAEYLNRRDHTTVISACRKIEKDIKTQENVYRDVDVLMKKIRSGL